MARRLPVSRGWPRGWPALVLVLGLAFGIALLARPAGRLVQGRPQVVDGDTLRVGGVTIRLAGMDAPELAQTCTRAGEPTRCGQAAREALARLVDGGTVACRDTGRDRYQRSLARCRAGTEDVGRWLVLQGLAVAYGDYEDEEAEARSRSRGLWAGTFERPSEWRRSH